jgi:predicted dehydrogenase
MKPAVRFSRRSFVGRLGAASLATPFFVRNLMSAPPSNQVRHASFGADGMGGSDMLTIAQHPQVKLVCVAEVDKNRLGRLKKSLPNSKATIYQDWRELLDKEGKHLDTANVGTPDHMHAPIAMSAMQLGLHVYVQKPMTHDLYEARRLTEFAREKKLVTQMGIQIHSSPYYRMGVAILRSGAIGKVKEVHLWSDRKWGDTKPLPRKSDPVPAALNWDLWLGVCAPRPFIAGYYHPGIWRDRVDFGTGSLGDMGCHIFDPMFEALALGSPISVRSEGEAANRWNWAINETIHYVFPATPYTDGPTVKFTWYDGDARPPKEILALLGDVPRPGNGSIAVGTKGAMLLPHCGQRPVLLPKARYADYQLPKVTGTNHNFQFIDAVLGKGKTSAPFDYSGPLTEAVLLGALATLFSKTTLQWDSAALEVKNLPEASHYIRRAYRHGWDVKGIS